MQINLAGSELIPWVGKTPNGQPMALTSTNIPVRKIKHMFEKHLPFLFFPPCVSVVEQCNCSLGWSQRKADHPSFVSGIAALGSVASHQGDFSTFDAGQDSGCPFFCFGEKLRRSAGRPDVSFSRRAFLTYQTLFNLLMERGKERLSK